MVASARVAWFARRGSDYGVQTGNIRVENHTIASQVAALRDYAEAHEYKVPAEW